MRTLTHCLFAGLAAALAASLAVGAERDNSRPQENGPDTRGVKIEEAHRTAPVDKPEAGKDAGRDALAEGDCRSLDAEERAACEKRARKARAAAGRSGAGRPAAR